jgi:GH24 family phage-related lysozyme (muramidase)
MKEKLMELIRKREGLKFKAYWDVDHWSIGFGTKSFEGEQITEEEAEKRMSNHLDLTILEFAKLFHNEIKQINEVRKIAICDMIYNMGITRFKTFKNMIADIKCDFGINWSSVAFEVLDSKYHKEHLKNNSKRSTINARNIKNGF